MVSRSIYLLTIGLVLGLLHAGLVGAEPMGLTYLGASSTNLDNPHDLKLTPDGRYLFVADVGNNRVVILDPKTLDFIAAFGEDHQSGTHDIDFDRNGRVYIADTHNNRVTIYEIQDRAGTPSARLVGEIGERIRGPEGVLAHPNGRLYVAGAWSNNVVVYDRQKVVGELKGLSSPHDLELAPDGNIWLADAGNDRMLLLSPDLEILHELSGPPYHFNGVRYQDIMPDGTIIAADKNNHAIKIIGPDGQLRAVLGEEKKPGKGPGRFRTPEGVEIDGKTIWLSDSGNNRIVKYAIQ